MTTRTIAFAAPLLIAFAAVVLATQVQAWWWQDDPVATHPVTELQWEDLLPRGFEPPTDPFATMTQDEIDKILDGRSVRVVDGVTIEMVDQRYATVSRPGNLTADLQQHPANSRAGHR